MIHRPSRRLFLQGLGLSVASAAVLRLTEARAATGLSPLRFLFVYTSAGRDSNSMCTGTGSQFQLGEGLAALDAIKEKVMVVDGLRIPDHTGEEHPCGRSSMLTAFAANDRSRSNSISFDRFLANSISNGDSLYTGRSSPAGDIDLPISWQGADTPNENYVEGSSNLLEHLFPGGTTSSEGGEISKPPSEDELSLNSYLAQQVERMHQLAPAADQDQLALHLKTLAQLRAEIEGGSSTSRSCAALGTSSADDEHDRIARLVVHGLACGRTSVAVLRIGDEEPHHEYSHWHDSTEYRGKLRDLDKDEAARFVRLIQLLDSYPEGNGTLLDNTIVVWSSEVAGGYDEDIHGTRNMPFVLAGGGNILKLGQRIVTSGRSNAQLYRAIAHRMGITGALEFGDPKMGAGMLEDILV